MSEAVFAKFSVRKAFAKTGPSGKIALTLATWFGSGLFPLAPGTFATLITLPMMFWLGRQGPSWQVPVLGGAVFVGIWSAGRAEKLLGKRDPHEIVIDEVAGFLLTMFLIPSSEMDLAGGFILFRALDVLKPFPIKKMEGLKGGWGVVADDLMAGLYAQGIMRLAHTLWA